MDNTPAKYEERIKIFQTILMPSLQLLYKALYGTPDDVF